MPLEFDNDGNAPPLKRAVRHTVVVARGVMIIVDGGGGVMSMGNAFKMNRIFREELNVKVKCEHKR